MNAPAILRAEALGYLDPRGACCFGSRQLVAPEKAVVANCSAVRELDANGTNFGYDPKRGHTRGEFGHNDFYPVAIAAAQQRGLNGRQTLKDLVALTRTNAPELSRTTGLLRLKGDGPIELRKALPTESRPDRR